LTKATTVIEKFRHRARSYDRLLLKVGCISLITTLVLWLLFREASQQQPASAPAPTQTTASANVEPNSQFSEYMQQSLQAIDQKTQASNPTGIASNVPAGSMPSVIVPGSPTPGIAPPGSTTGVPNSAPSTRLATGLERVYGSTYRLPQNLPSGNSPTLAPPVAPLPSALPKVATAPVKPPLPLQIPGVAHTLVGVVDLGEQSAILVEVNGVAQRFRLGESIGSSGWALVEVSKNQAIIRRNGEVRSVFIGQNF
jgi:type II secretory pathway component PulC